MFGFSFGELVVLVIVSIVVIGPKDLPKVLRKLGQWASKARRMASELRAQSGIDDVLRGEGIAEDIAEIRRLARGELDQVTRAADLRGPLMSAGGAVGTAASAARDPYAAAPGDDGLVIERQREYPSEGADGYRALPDTAIVYAESLPRSSLARDPLYLFGDPNAPLPPDPAAVIAGLEPASEAVVATENGTTENGATESGASDEPAHPRSATSP